MKKLVIIEGMTCGHCVKRVENALKEVAGVEKVDVILDENKAIIEVGENINDEIIAGAVDDAGYTVISITNM